MSFQGWTIKQLQDFIRSKGGNPDDCEEKSDLIQRATYLNSAPAQSQTGPPRAYEPPIITGPGFGGPAPAGFGAGFPAPAYGAAPPFAAPPYGSQPYAAPPYGAPPPYGQPYGAPSTPSPHLAPPYGGPPPRGRKKALICACNYAGSSAELKGCVNDAKCMAYLLKTKFGFRDEDITMLTDDQGNPAMWPTRANMTNAMHQLVHGAQPGDSLFFHYSGHGSQTADWSGDEHDGYNETLCPCDFKHAGQIVDDELNQYLVNTIPQGVVLHAVIDACHSGSMLDLEFRAEFDTGAGFPSWTNEYGNRPMRYKGTAGGEVFQFGASRDSQTAADTAALSGNVSTGAATFSFIQAVERCGTHISYGRLLHEMAITLSQMGGGGGGPSSMPLPGLLGALLGAGMSFGGSGYQGQNPVLSCNSPFDFNRPICM